MGDLPLHRVRIHSDAMSRPPRIEYSGACYHVINRGNYRRSLFLDRGASAAFERTLSEAAARFGWWLHAYNVMSNHFHLALELTEPNLSHGMKWLQGTWIRRYNGFRRLVGRPFQGRYKSILVESGESFGRVCHYIHLNPVRAGLVVPSAAVEYPWSSLPKFVRGPRPRWLAARTALHEAGGLADTPDGWMNYLRYLEFLAEDDASKKILKAENLSRGWCLGSAAFRREMRENLALREAEVDRFAGLEPEAVLTERQQVWTERLAHLAPAVGLDLNDLPARKSDPRKVLLAAALKLTTSVSNAWLAARLRMGRPSSVSQFVGRMLRDPAAAARLQSLLSRVET